MSKGYVYIMTTAVDGIIKIGRSDNWTRRCQDQLETNGYKNMNGLKTYFVAKVDNQEEIESIMHDIFRESRVSNFEMFAVDKDRAKRVLSKMGEQVYPDIVNSNSITKTSANVEQLYIQLWSRINNLMSKRSDIKFNSNITNSNKKFIDIKIPIKGFWLHAWFSRRSNQFNIDLGANGLAKHDLIKKYNTILSSKLSFDVLCEKYSSYERIIHYENNVNCNNLSDAELNHFIDLIVEFYNAILTL